MRNGQGSREEWPEQNSFSREVALQVVMEKGLKSHLEPVSREVKLYAVAPGEPLATSLTHIICTCHLRLMLCLPLIGPNVFGQPKAQHKTSIIIPVRYLTCLHGL